MSNNRIGFGFDIHQFINDPVRPLMLGGVHVDHELALQGHSDADVISHAITDALLGAACLGDMGEHFPDTDSAWKDANSVDMLKHAVELVREAGYKTANVDCTVILEKPKIAPHRNAIQMSLSTVLDAPVSVKAGRAEGLGAIGRVEGAACWAVALLEEVK